MEEISGHSKICLYDGSTYVDRSFRKALTEHLAKVFPATAVTEKHLERALGTFATIKKPEFSLSIKDTGFGKFLTTTTTLMAADLKFLGKNVDFLSLS
jgi:hypothetical protein